MSKENKQQTSLVELPEFTKENQLLKATLIEIDGTSNGKIDINGQLYTKVQKRVEVFRKNFGFNARISTEIAHMDDVFVLVKASIAILKDSTWLEVATGHAEERRDSSEINKFSAIENAETSSIGRALACLGISGAEYASAEELIIALAQQQKVTTSEGNDKKSSKSPNPVSEHQISYMIKLIEKTGANKEKFLEHYNVKEIEELTLSQANDAISKLKKKESLKTTMQDAEKKKTETDKTLEVLQENNEVKFKSIDTDNDTEELETHSLDQIELKSEEDAKENAKEEVVEDTKEDAIEDTKEEAVDDAKKEELVEAPKEETIEAPKEEAIDDAKKEELVEDTKDKSKKKPSEKSSKAKGAKTKSSKSKTTKKGKEPLKREKLDNDLEEGDEILI